jgi:hypothetical protein
MVVRLKMHATDCDEVGCVKCKHEQPGKYVAENCSPFRTASAALNLL